VAHATPERTQTLSIKTPLTAEARERIERAHGGTLFLDEVGELPPEAQVRLLRVLQEKEIDRIGGSEPVKVDIRVIAATHCNLETMVAGGRFREDLYFRLKVFPIAIPPLRDRRADIPALVQYFVLKKSREMKRGLVPSLAPGAMDHLMGYRWPGNVRELENAVERALILNQQGPLASKEIPMEPAPAAPGTDSVPDHYPLHLHPADSIPRFAWGKFFKEGRFLKMPLNVQAHHALMDGIHVGKFYEKVHGYLKKPEAVLGDV